MDRLAARIYCGVAAFEREHAHGHEKKEDYATGFRLVCTNKGSVARKAICLVRRMHVASFDGRHIELLLCTALPIERLEFSF